MEAVQAGDMHRASRMLRRLCVYCFRVRPGGQSGALRMAALAPIRT